MNKKICCIGCLHGFLPKIEPCDLLLIGGDICPPYNHDEQFQIDWLGSVFANWIEKLPVKDVIYCFGNHELLGSPSIKLQRILSGFNYRAEYSFYLENSSIVWNGLKIWGSPYSIRFGDWAFMDTDDNLKEYWDMIPLDTDILMVHGPAYGILDFALYGTRRTGSKTLLNKLNELKQLKLFHTNHIHESRGLAKHNNILCVNSCIMDFWYRPINKPIYLSYNENDGFISYSST